MALVCELIFIFHYQVDHPTFSLSIVIWRGDAVTFLQSVALDGEMEMRRQNPSYHTRTPRMRKQPV